MTLKICYLLFQNSNEAESEVGGNLYERISYGGGYMGLVEGRYILFACESDYREYLEEYDND